MGIATRNEEGVVHVVYSLYLLLSMPVVFAG